MKVAMEIVGALRSSKSNMGIAKKETALFLRCKDPSTEKIASTFKREIASLTKCSEVEENMFL